MQKIVSVSIYSIAPWQVLFKSYYSDIRLARANNLKILSLDDIVAHADVSPKELLTTMLYQKNSIHIRTFQDKLQEMELQFQ